SLLLPLANPQPPVVVFLGATPVCPGFGLVRRENRQRRFPLLRRRHNRKHQRGSTLWLPSPSTPASADAPPTLSKRITACLSMGNLSRRLPDRHSLSITPPPAM